MIVRRDCESGLPERIARKDCEQVGQTRWTERIARRMARIDGQREWPERMATKG